MYKPTIICFTGMDGAGKTTHALKLLDNFRKKRVPCNYIWCRWVPGSADVFHFLVRKSLGFTSKQYKYSQPLDMIYRYLKILDFTVSLFFKARIPLFFGHCIIFDRYLYDSLADLCFEGFDTSPHRRFVTLLLCTNPKPNLVFLISVKPQVAVLRKNDLSLPEASKYSEIYNEMMKTYHFIEIVNTDFAQAEKEIMNNIENAKINERT